MKRNLLWLWWWFFGISEIGHDAQVFGNQIANHHASCGSALSHLTIEDDRAIRIKKGTFPSQTIQNIIKISHFWGPVHR